MSRLGRAAFTIGEHSPGEAGVHAFDVADPNRNGAPFMVSRENVDAQSYHRESLGSSEALQQLPTRRLGILQYLRALVRPALPAWPDEALTPRSAEGVSARVLCVDMDGTLLATDTLWESLLALLKRQPWRIVSLPMWLLRGRAYLKQQVAERTVLDPSILPYREDVLNFLRREKDAGREIILATAADRKLAESVASYLSLFTAVLASDGNSNLAGARKLSAVESYVGSKGFDYVGNSRADIPLWKAASVRLVVNPTPRLLREVQRIGETYSIVSGSAGRLHPLLQAMRLPQWAKNVLVFIPLLTSHKLLEWGLVRSSIFAFLSFGLCASSTYIMNDLFDLESDRRHPKKRRRPFAAGTLPIATGLVLATGLLAGGLLVADLLVSSLFVGVVGLYVAITTGYSLALKRILAADVFVLAALYTLRVLAGGVATDIPISQWLLAFSMFFFLSLAFIKRYGELRNLAASGAALANGRGYLVNDKELVRSFGVTSGYLSLLVLALYISSKEVTILYRHPQTLWLMCLLLLYWVTRMWFLAERGVIDEDPVLFTLRDPVSYALGVGVGLVALAAL